MLAANDGHVHIVSLLIAHKADVNLKSNPPHENTALILACGKGHGECVRLLLAVDGIDENAANIDRSTALMIACHKNNYECVRLLLSVDGIEVNASNSEQWTALMVACNEGHGECVGLLLAVDGIDVNAKNKYQMYSIDDGRRQWT